MFPMITILLLVNIPGHHFEPNAKAQLDLPPLPPPSSANPEIMLNSYVEGRDNSDNDDDDDRSIRNGPPYDDRTDELIDKYRNGRQHENFRINLNPNTDENLRIHPDRNNNEYGRANYDRVNDDNYRDRENINQNGRANYDREQNYRPNYNQGQNYRPPYNEYNQRNPYQNDGDYERFRLEEERREKQKTEHLKTLLSEIDKKSSHECSINVAAQWLFETNVNDVTQLEALAAQHRYSDFQRALFYEMKKINQSDIYDEFLYRQVRLMSVIGPNALLPDQLDRYNRLVSDMLAVYNGAAICAHEQPFQCGLKLQPHLKEIMAKSRDWDELQYTWLEWRRKTGRNVRDLYEQVVELTNEAAHTNNFTSGEEYWQFPFDAGNFRQDMDDVWSQVLPLYEQLHTFVRRKLREFYGPDKIRRDAPIPDHILGNMYGQSWSNILDITIPYPGRKFLEVTPAMLAQSYTPLVIWQIAEEFYISMNMTALPQDFWFNSILEEPIDRVTLCQPSAWDFCNGQDYRIKMCTHITHKDLITAHHELSHIHYFLNYRDLPKVFRDGANPGFHEAIGDAIGLSVATPHHLQKLGLVQKSVDDTAHDINFLFALAMDKVVFLPFALALETWRWDIFSGRISREEYNCHWWLLREQYGGIKPPVLRSELDFDAGSKYHVLANIPYIRNLFRLSKSAFKDLLDDLNPKLKDIKRSSAVPIILKLAAALRFFSEGPYHKGVGNDFNLGLAQPIFFLIFKEIVNLLETHICPKWIKFEYTDDEKRAAKMYFYDLCRIPGVIGCVDGTHIKIISPGEQTQHLYYNRKGFHSINAMLIYDHQMKFRYVNAKHPGASHDSMIWNLSNAKIVLKTMQGNGDNTSWLLGDSGYMLDTILLTPIS